MMLSLMKQPLVFEVGLRERLWGYKFFDLKKRVGKLDGKILIGYDVIINLLSGLEVQGRITCFAVTYDVVLGVLGLVKSYGLLPG